MKAEQRKSNLSQGLALLFLVINIMLLTAIMAPANHYNPSVVLSQTNQETMAIPQTTVNPLQKTQFHWKLVDTYIEGDWRVEKYQEFEFYLNDKGQVEKEVPTAHYNYLRYWRY